MAVHNYQIHKHAELGHCTGTKTMMRQFLCWDYSLSPNLSDELMVRQLRALEHPETRNTGPDTLDWACVSKKMKLREFLRCLHVRQSTKIGPVIWKTNRSQNLKTRTDFQTSPVAVGWHIVCAAPLGDDHYRALWRPAGGLPAQQEHPVNDHSQKNHELRRWEVSTEGQVSIFTPVSAQLKGVTVTVLDTRCSFLLWWSVLERCSILVHIQYVIIIAHWFHFCLLCNWEKIVTLT